MAELTLWSNFKPSEFKCGCDCGLGIGQMQQSSIDKLIQARIYAGVPFVINCAIRCAKHNVEVGGVINSAHLTGHALDIKADDSDLRFRILAGLIKAGFNRIGIYDTFIHVDDDPAKPSHVCW